MKFIVILLTFFQLLFAQVETVSVGKIDNRYSSLVSKKQLVTIIKDIEKLFESQLGFDVFDYEEYGKPIDIIYLPPSQKKKRIEKEKAKQASLKEQLDFLRSSISKDNTLLKSKKVDLESKYKNLNRKIESLNNYISRKNSQRNLNKNDYNSIKHHISSKKSAIQMKKTELDRKKRDYNSDARSLQRKLNKRINLLRKYKYTVRNIERLSRNYKEIKGQTTKHVLTTVKTSEKNGERYTQTDKVYDAQKIEIYDFENLTLLKVILAHEIAHLVGVEHISTPGSLMHPQLQQKQVQKLFLTPEDIQVFERVFL